jgi:transcription elongation GreA/GreB family factor
MLNKTSLQTVLTNLQEAQLQQSRDAYASYLADAARDRSEPTDQDQASQAFGNAELAEFFEGPTRTYEAGLKRLQTIDFGPKSRVEEGAAVQLDGRWYVVGVATQSFECDGLTYMGISTEAPIYQALEGAVAGDTVTYHGREWKVQNVA